jgi:uncharacterized protein YqjF (DUF2071 family)
MVRLLPIGKHTLVSLLAGKHLAEPLTAAVWVVRNNGRVPASEIAVLAPALPRPVVTAQRWMDLTFLHWPVDPAAVAGYFPPGSRPDVRDGVTYVGLIPFSMRGAGPASSCPVPYFGNFAETNVRLYSVDDAGRHGIVFRSLETQRLAIVGLTRALLGLNYTWAWMSVSRYGDVITYQSRRRWPAPGLSTRISIRVGEPTEPDELTTWLTARWGLHTRIAGHTVWLPNAHPSWPLRRAEVLDLSDELVRAAGITPDGLMLPALYSTGVRTSFGRPSLVKATS